MSAIVGILNLDGRPVDPVDVRKMVDCVAPWPADDIGIWCRDFVGLGHRMMHITPESFQEKLPLRAADGCVLSGDARIDNRTELIGQLGLGDRPTADISDSDLILCAYEKWGEDCPNMLIGDFAFAIWDPRARKLFCARDAMGVRPFYYSASPRQFLFASSLKAILTFPGVPRQLNEHKLGLYILKQFDEDLQTFYRNIFRLPGGCSVVVRFSGGVEVRKWWNLDIKHEIHLGSDGEYAAAFREIFMESVRCRLRSAFPVGSMLSGGLDSSSVACAAKSLYHVNGKGPLHTYSGIFPTMADFDRRIDERSYQQTVVKQGGVCHHDIVMDRFSPIFDLLWNGPEPIPAYNCYMEHAIFSDARGRGVRTLLTGYDGDCIITYGYERLVKLFSTGRWIELGKEARCLAEIWHVPVRRVIWSLAVKPFLPESLLNLYHTIRGHKVISSLDRAFINPQFFRRMGLADYLRDREVEKARLKTSRAVHKAGILFVKSSNEVIHEIASPFSIEPSHPFFDRRLIEFCLALPLSKKLAKGRDRAILRWAMQDVLPQEILERHDKGDLSANFYCQLLSCHRGEIESLLSIDSCWIQEYFDLDRLRSGYAGYLSNPMRSNDASINIFLALVLFKWLKSSEIGSS